MKTGCAPSRPHVHTVCVYTHTQTAHTRAHAHTQCIVLICETLKKRHNKAFPLPVEHKIKPHSPSGNPDGCSACVLTKFRAAGTRPFFHSCSSFVSFFFSCSLSLSFLLSLCLCPLPKALKRDENHSTERGEVTNPLALLCWKAGFEQGPWHK